MINIHNGHQEKYDYDSETLFLIKTKKNTKSYRRKYTKCMKMFKNRTSHEDTDPAVDM